MPMVRCWRWAPRKRISTELSHAGAVYLYQRSPSGNWSLAATLQAPTPTALDRFGFSVDLSADGRTLKVDGYAPWKASSGAPMFRSHIFIRPGSTWEYLVALAGVWDGDECENTRLSSDANYLVLICNNFPHELPHVATYSRSGNSWFPGFDVGRYNFSTKGHASVSLWTSTPATWRCRTRVRSSGPSSAFSRGFWRWWSPFTFAGG
jgi:hypothetical protein